MENAKITALKNGPFRVRHIRKMKRAKGEELACKEEMYLCRCGESANKPYCDGTHMRNGFTGENQEEGIRNKTIAYRGKEITIYDNRNICSHAGYCTGELPTVFSFDSPWIDPNGDTVEKIIAICKKCPSGALSYALKSGERSFDEEEEEALIHVIGRKRQGPYAITGKVKLEGQLDRQPEAPNKMTLCRCGQSKNKPYCNGDHRFVGEEEEMEKTMIDQVAFTSTYFDLYKINGQCYAAISNTPDNISNAGFVDLGDRVVVYDTFLSVEAAKDMRRAIEEITKAKDTVIVLSHWHSDHYLGNCAFPKETLILSSIAADKKIRETMPALQDREELLKEIHELELERKKTEDEKEILQIENALKFNRNFTHPELELRYPNCTFEGRIKLAGKKAELELRSIDIAHSEGDVVGFVEKDRVFYAGDLVFSDNHPYLGAGDPLKLKEELRKILEMDVEYIIPGHGKICDKEEVVNKIDYIDAIMELVKENLNSDRELSTQDLPKKFHHYASPSFEWNVNFLRERVKQEFNQ